MYDLDVAMFRGNRPLAQVLSELVLQFDIDGFFRVRFLRSEFSYPKEYLEVSESVCACAVAFHVAPVVPRRVAR